ncbi:MAG TPA: homocysteine S-methyltransferase family protein, partial [Gemmatimonadaceae bacterium]
MATSAHGGSTSEYLRALSKRVLVYDGAMGTNIQLHHPTPDDFGGKSLEECNDHLVLTRPDIIQSIHESFLAVGCDVVETCTFQSTPHRLREWGIEEKTRELNVAAARLARAACDKYATPDKPRFVAGSIGPTGLLLSSNDPVLSNTTFAELEENYYTQAKYLVEGGVDVLLVETAQDILEVKAAIAGFERLFAEIGRRVVIQAQVTLDTSGRMLLGTDIASAMTTLEALRVDVIGLNCSTGPEHMREPIRFLAENSTRPVSCIPNAGLPLNTGTGDAVYPLEPEPMAEMLGEFVEQFGVRIVGGCCGTKPEHLAAIAARVAGSGKREERSGNATETSRGGHHERSEGSALAGSIHGSKIPRASSAMRATDFEQNPKPLLIGERVNAQGSRKVKRLLLAEDYEAIGDVAREQV